MFRMITVRVWEKMMLNPRVKKKTEDEEDRKMKSGSTLRWVGGWFWRLNKKEEEMVY
jgi:hypothetical protein